MEVVCAYRIQIVIIMVTDLHWYKLPLCRRVLGRPEPLLVAGTPRSQVELCWEGLAAVERLCAFQPTASCGLHSIQPSQTRHVLLVDIRAGCIWLHQYQLWIGRVSSQDSGRTGTKSERLAHPQVSCPLLCSRLSMREGVCRLPPPPY